MRDTIKKAWNQGQTFDQYENLFETVVAEGKTTGPNQSDGYVSFTKLNWSRYKRTLKQLSENEIPTVSVSSPLNVLIITEAWCGDASQTLPVFKLLEQNNENFNIKIVLRDEHEELMNNYLTNGSKSIPKVIVLDEVFNELAQWGPRPSVLQQLVVDFKKANPTSTGMDVAGITQKWYGEDKGQSTFEEIESIISSVEKVV